MPTRRTFVAHPRHPLTGKQFRVSARTDRELQAILHHVDQLREGLRLGTKGEDEIDRSLRRLVHGPVTLERAANVYIAQASISKNTRAAIRSFLRGAGAPLARRELAELGANVLDAWIGRLQGVVSAGSIASYWWRLRMIVRFAHVREWIGRSPWGSWRPVIRGATRVRARESARSLEELDRIFLAARDEDEARALSGWLPDVEAKVITTAVLGLRQGELAGLRWTDLDRERGLVVIARQWDGAPPKGKAVKPLRAPPELFAILARHRAQLAAAGLDARAGPIFPSMKRSRKERRGPLHYVAGECLTRGTLRAVVARARLPNPERWTPHSLRDTFANLEAPMHPDLATLAERTRHASLSSLLRYLRAARRELAPPGISLAGSQTRRLKA